MAIVQLHPDAAKSAYLRGGQYGPGLAHEASCEITDYQFPALESPRYAPETPREDWAFLRIRVNSDEFGSVTIFHHEPIGSYQRSKLGGWLTGLGVPCEGLTFRHDDEQIVGRKCGVEVLDPRKDKNEENVFYTGKLIGVFGTA